MTLSRPLVVSVGLAAGLVAAVGFYTAAAGADAPQRVVAKPHPVPAVEVVTPEPVVSFAPCAKPAKLEHGACVTHKVVTKVVAAPAAPVAAVSTPRRSESAPGRTTTVAAARTQPSAQQPAAPQAAAPRPSADEAATAERKDAEPGDHEGTEAGQPGGDHHDEPGDAAEPGDD